jgi:ABC-type transport system involved in multi-copper enzyme maturation permease subunit
MTTAVAPVTLAGKVTQARATRSEWTKFRSLRSSWWTTAMSVVITVGLGAVISLAAAHSSNVDTSTHEVATRTQIGGIFAQLVLGVLAVLLISGEYGTGMIRSSMAAVPRRLPVLWAKLSVYVAVVFPLTLASSFAAFWLGQVAWQSQGQTAVGIGDPEVLRIVVGTALYLTVAGVLALAIGTLLRNSAAAISAVVGLFFVLPIVFQAMPASIARYAEYLPSNAGGALSDVATSPTVLSPWTGFALLGGYTVAATAAAAWRLRRTDV